jgi:hypothetical protein
MQDWGDPAGRKAFLKAYGREQLTRSRAKKALEAGLAPTRDARRSALLLRLGAAATTSREQDAGQQPPQRWTDASGGPVRVHPLEAAGAVDAPGLAGAPRPSDAESAFDQGPAEDLRQRVSGLLHDDAAALTAPAGGVQPLEEAGEGAGWEGDIPTVFEGRLSEAGSGGLGRDGAAGPAGAWAVPLAGGGQGPREAAPQDGGWGWEDGQPQHGGEQAELLAALREEAAQLRAALAAAQADAQAHQAAAAALQQQLPNSAAAADEAARLGAALAAAEAALLAARVEAAEQLGEACSQVVELGEALEASRREAAQHAAALAASDAARAELEARAAAVQAQADSAAAQLQELRAQLDGSAEEARQLAARLSEAEASLMDERRRAAEAGSEAAAAAAQAEAQAQAQRAEAEAAGRRAAEAALAMLRAAAAARECELLATIDELEDAAGETGGEAERRAEAAAARARAQEARLRQVRPRGGGGEGRGSELRCLGAVLPDALLCCGRYLTRTHSACAAVNPQELSAAQARAAEAEAEAAAAQQVGSMSQS